MKKIEDEHTQKSIPELVQEMQTLCGLEHAYSVVHMKKKVLAHFGDAVVLTEEEGQACVLTFRNRMSTLLQNFYNRKTRLNLEEEKKAIISTAAKLINEDILSIPGKDRIYPTADEIESETLNTEYVPNSLRLFLNSLFSKVDKPIKVSSIGQAIIQATRPRGLIAPLQIGLGIQMHHHFGSRFLVDTLYSLGFSSSYTEVQRFEMNAASKPVDSDAIKKDAYFLQYVADNVDHNVRTIDGHGTFHGMGIISVSTPGSQERRTIPRLNPSLTEITELAKIHVKFYKEPPAILNTLKFGVLSEKEIANKTWSIDLLSKVCWPVKRNASWSAIMHKTKGNYPGKSSITFLPMINLNPSDESCIYTTLHFVCKEAHKNKCTPILTFDQPLYWKAMMLIQNEPKDSPLKSLVLKLGGFHTEMSFVGCIGYLMSGSGLVSILETVYAATAVTHMMTGKAIARAG